MLWIRLQPERVAYVMDVAARRSTLGTIILCVSCTSFTRYGNENKGYKPEPSAYSHGWMDERAELALASIRIR